MPRRTRLATALRQEQAPSPLPLVLPAVHVSVAAWFSATVEAGSLVPRYCKVFRRDILYLFYGALLYRPNHAVTQDNAYLPIAFLFHPEVLAKASDYFPFDTGALSSGRFGVEWTAELHPFKERFGVAGNGDLKAPAKLVAHLYESNSSYHDGQVSAACRNRSEPYPTLHRFLTDDLTALGVDQRHQTIECHFRSTLDLGRSLEWIAFPEAEMGTFLKLLESAAPHVPQYYAYSSHRTFHPAQVTARLEVKARELVEQRFFERPQ